MSDVAAPISDRMSRRPLIPFATAAAGILILAWLWLGPLPAMSRSAFSPHMLLHLGVVVVAAPLVALGLSRLVRTPSSFRDAFAWFALAAAVETVAVWGWHVPLLHDLAGRGGVPFDLEQLSFVIAGVALWTAAFAARSKATAAAAAIVLFFTFAHMTMFGLVLTLSPRLLYDPQLCGGAFGLDPLDDQHLGGVLMALGAGLPYLVATGFAVQRLMCSPN